MSWDQKPVITSGGRSFINPETPTGRYYALDPGFHGVPARPAHPARDADGADVT
jgi:hypothetical protein